MADLSGASLNHASLGSANLSGARLWGADLRKADLSGVRGITEEELDKQAHSLQDATMPDGQKYEEWKKSRGQEDSGS